MLSDLSPMRANRSITSAGGIPNFSSTPAASSTEPVMVFTRVMCSSTNWAMSLSPVEITTGVPLAAACLARVPMTSSASTPSTQSRGRPIACTMP